MLEEIRDFLCGPIGPVPVTSFVAGEAAFAPHSPLRRLLIDPSPRLSGSHPRLLLLFGLGPTHAPNLPKRRGPAKRLVLVANGYRKRFAALVANQQPADVVQSAKQPYIHPHEMADPVRSSSRWNRQW